MSYVDAELMFDCDYCGAQVGDWCVTKSGRRATPNVHSSRYQAVRKVIEHTGYNDEFTAMHRHRRAVADAIRELHTLVDDMETVESAWLRIRLSEILAVR